MSWILWSGHICLQEDAEALGKIQRRVRRWPGHGILPHKQSLNRLELSQIKQSLKGAMWEGGLRILTVRELLRITDQQVPPLPLIKWASTQGTRCLSFLPLAFYPLSHTSWKWTGHQLSCKLQEQGEAKGYLTEAGGQNLEKLPPLRICQWDGSHTVRCRECAVPNSSSACACYSYVKMQRVK